MLYRSTLTAAAALLMLTSGCSFITDLVSPTTTTVRLVNNGDFDVHVSLFYSAQQNDLRATLTEFGTEVEYTIAAGDSVTFSRNCDDLQAIVIDNADLMVIGQIGPNTDSDVQRDGTDFGCGDTITFTFDHGPTFIDFNVSVSVS